MRQSDQTSRPSHRCQYDPGALRAGYLRLQTHSEYVNTSCFSTAPMVTRTRLHLTRYTLPTVFLKYRSHDCQARPQAARNRHTHWHSRRFSSPQVRVLGSSLSTLFCHCSTLTFIFQKLLLYPRINGRTFQRQRRSVDNDRATTEQSPSSFSGFYAERVFVRDIQRTAKDTSKCKPG